DEIEVKILNVDAKEKTIQLSFKAKNATKPKAAKKKVGAEESSDNAGTTNLGALLKAKLDSKK
ncbi:MAG: 30S ribosomal protein S1, partial [Candidatus Methylopumilus sp.]|nr:30S ribosomal protein S1 [Candidatus Methylopumilus sp.]